VPWPLAKRNKWDTAARFMLQLKKEATQTHLYFFLVHFFGLSATANTQIANLLVLLLRTKFALTQDSQDRLLKTGQE
jgi:hypothetical protein